MRLGFLLLITLAEISTMGGVWWRPEPCRCLIRHCFPATSLVFCFVSATIFVVFCGHCPQAHASGLCFGPDVCHVSKDNCRLLFAQLVAGFLFDMGIGNAYTCAGRCSLALCGGCCGKHGCLHGLVTLLALLVSPGRPTRNLDIASFWLSCTLLPFSQFALSP